MTTDNKETKALEVTKERKRRGPYRLHQRPTINYVRGRITRRLPRGENVEMSFVGKLLIKEGTREQAEEALLEVEMHGNDGKARIHLFLE